jgi:hypothetical protein
MIFARNCVNYDKQYALGTGNTKLTTDTTNYTSQTYERSEHY